MITRIRYETEKGVMKSVTPLLAKTTMITVTINLVNMSYIIHDDNGIPLVGGSTTSKQKVLNEVKTKVKELGVVFHDEIRPRKVKRVKVLTENVDELVNNY